MAEFVPLARCGSGCWITWGSVSFVLHVVELWLKGVTELSLLRNCTLQKMGRVLCPPIPGFKSLLDPIGEEKHHPPFSFSKAVLTVCSGRGWTFYLLYNFSCFGAKQVPEMLQFGGGVPGKSSAWHEFGKVCQRSDGEILMFVPWYPLTVEKQLCLGEEGFQEMFELFWLEFENSAVLSCCEYTLKKKATKNIFTILGAVDQLLKKKTKKL